MALKWQLRDELRGRGRKGMGWGVVFSEFCDWVTGGQHVYKRVGVIPGDPPESGLQCRVCRVFISYRTLFELDEPEPCTTITGSSNTTATGSMSVKFDG